MAEPKKAAGKAVAREAGHPPLVPLPEVEPVTLADPRLDAARFALDGIDVSEKPKFTVSEAAKFFFAKSPHWIRWLEGRQAFVLDGEDVGGKRTEQGARYYDLADIEKMAHALAAHGHITAGQLRNTLLLVQTSARQWGYL